MANAIYYAPQIPSIGENEIKSRATYNHAVAIAQNTEKSVLFTHKAPSNSVVDMFDEYYKITPNSGVGKILKSVSLAHSITENNREDWVYVTSFQYVPASSGILSDIEWVVDANDNPRQYMMTSSNPGIHRIINPVLRQVIDRADTVIHTPHPSSPDTYGKNKRYVRNGAPTSLTPDKVRDDSKFKRKNLKMSWVGVHEGIEIIFKTLSIMEDPIPIDIYGGIDKQLVESVEKYGISSYVSLAGKVSHEDLIKELPRYAFGLCVLPPRQDFYYSYPVKVGEYLASGVIPIMSDYPGMRAMARNTGKYVQFDPYELANCINELKNKSVSDLSDMSAKCLKRADSISWKEERTWFAEQALSR